MLLLLIAAVLATAGRPASFVLQQDVHEENIKLCASSDTQPDSIIRGCTALIQTSQEPKHNLIGAFYNRGNAYRLKGDTERAIRDFDQALLLNPNFVRALGNRGTVYMDKKDYNRAIEDFDRVIQLDPTNVLGFNNRGVANVRKGDYDRAIQDFNE